MPLMGLIPRRVVWHVVRTWVATTWHGGGDAMPSHVGCEGGCGGSTRDSLVVRKLRSGFRTRGGLVDCHPTNYPRGNRTLPRGFGSGKMMLEL